MKRLALNQLLQWKNSNERLPLIVEGARQVGKTYLLQEFGASYFPKTHYFNFENDPSLNEIFAKSLDVKKIISDLSIANRVDIDIENDLVIFDEIQMSPKTLTSLKYFAENMPQLHLCSAGSLLGLNLSPASYPVGKVNFLNMYPLSFEEFAIAIGEEKLLHNIFDENQFSTFLHKKLWDILKIYFITGGLPAVINTYIDNSVDPVKAFTSVRHKQLELIRTYHADIAKHCGKQNAMHIERLWRNIPEQLAKEQNGSANKFVFKDVIPSIKGYERLAGAIDWLTSTGLVIKVPIANNAELPLTAHVKENTFKLYIFDIGILGALSDLPPELIYSYDYGNYKGFFAENFVAQEFFTLGERLYAWKEKESEIEFLRQFNGKIVPVEVKANRVRRARSLDIFDEKYHPIAKVILSGETFSFNTNKKLFKIPLYLAAQSYKIWKNFQM